jgi:hypothetical protein
MNEQLSDRWLRETAASFHYPPTPDVVTATHARSRSQPEPVVRQLRPAWAVIALLLLLATLLAVPGVRAAMLEFFQIGAIRIFPQEGASKTPSPSLPDASETLLDLAGVTTWEAAQDNTGFPLRLPTYPEGLGAPDAVYYQQLAEPGLDVPVYVLLWRQPGGAGEAQLALYQIAVPDFAQKAASIAALQQTEVHDTLAYWVRGPHRIQLTNSEITDWLPVESNVLIWAEGGITYRLEGASTLDEAVRIAESLQ